MFRVLGSNLIIENALKNIEEWPKKSGKYILKKAMALTIAMVFYGLFRSQCIPLIIQTQDKWPESQK